ncbi:MAG TPA: hypothetical protein VN174_02690 [Candidatus Methanoperedens sp.]|nr:hypothetical protein [Candidatus Methanoperedens sp.]
MTKKNKIIIALVLLVIVVGVVAFWPRKDKVVKIVDTKVIIPNQIITDYGSDTGAKETKLTEKQYDEVYLIKTLRNGSPINKDYFLLDYDYNINKFVVSYKDINKGKIEFEEWLNNTGYINISKQYFKFKNE